MSRFNTNFELRPIICTPTESTRLPEACATIPLEVFGAIQIDRPDAAQDLLNFLPTMPGDDVQELWAGASGHVLLGQSLAFVRTLAGYLPNSDAAPARRCEPP